VEAAKSEFFRAVTLLKLPPFVHGSLIYAAAKGSMHRPEDEVMGRIRLFVHLPEIMHERLRLLDDWQVPSAVLSISGLIAMPYEQWNFTKNPRGGYLV